MNTHEALQARYALARQIAVEAGRSTLRYFQTDQFRVERKGDDSPVTVADREAEQLLRQRIEAAFPDDPIVGEEFGNKEGSSPWRWILDPIDGTKSFITGVPLYGTMVGIDYQQQARIGVVYFPGLDCGIYAAQGEGAWHFKGQAEPQRAKVCSTAKLADGVFVTSQVDTFADRTSTGAFEQLQERAYVTRTWGDCYGYYLVATGRAVAMVDALMSIWDAAALQPIMEEAGGKFTDWQGKARIDGGEGVGTNMAVHEEVIAITSQFERKLKQ
jgi:histidinol phosphatase-like enzyme (inositol monophosphatase family)